MHHVEPWQLLTLNHHHYPFYVLHQLCQSFFSVVFPLFSQLQHLGRNPIMRKKQKMLTLANKYWLPQHSIVFSYVIPDFAVEAALFNIA